MKTAKREHLRAATAGGCVLPPIPALAPAAHLLLLLLLLASLASALSSHVLNTALSWMPTSLLWTAGCAFQACVPIHSTAACMRAAAERVMGAECA